MAEYPDTLFQAYRLKGVLIDTNLMVLFAIGSYSLDRVGTFKRTTRYTRADYVLIMKIIAYFERRVTTPHILSEVDNLTRQLPEGEHEALSRVMAPLVSSLFEIYIASDEAIRGANYPGLGLVDCVTALAARDALVITDDFRLS
jgi:hypothetical protein